jgi:phosphoserine phosphatase RsbU/P
MEEIGGDMYDIIQIDKNNYGFLIADVSGHGVPSALITTMLKAIYSSNAKPGRSTSEITASINEEMTKMIGDMDHYFTAFIGNLDLESMTFTYTNAGHDPVVLYKAGTKKLIRLNTEGIIAGKFTGMEYGQGTIQIETGDGLLFYTDGIEEARDTDGKFYGAERLENIMMKTGHLKADEFVKAVYADLTAFCKNTPATDDRTMLYVKPV